MDNSAVFYRSPGDDYPMIVEASGYHLKDSTGHTLVDLTSGISSTALIGQGRVEIADAIRDQITRVSYVHSSGATNPAQEELARRLVALAPGDLNRVMFTSGGSEANEVALRIIRQYHLARGKPHKRAVITLHPSYHGATAGALSLTGRWDINRDYEPYLFDVHHVPAPISFRGPFRDMEPDRLAAAAADAVEAAIQSMGPDQVSAFVAEPISLSTGMAVPPDSYWHRIREICDRHDVVLMVDEIITGMGRTGSHLRSSEVGLTPDVLTLAKGLAAGYAPLGATIVSDRMVDAIGSTHRRMAEVHTHSGAPIPCAVGLAVLDVIEREDLIRSAKEKGEELRQILEAELAGLTFVGDIRGIGLMQAVEYVTDHETRQTLPQKTDAARTVTKSMWDRGFLVRTMHHSSDSVGDCTVFMPALTASVDDMAAGVSVLRDVLVGLENPWKESLS